MRIAGIGSAFAVVCAFAACGGNEAADAARPASVNTRDGQLLYTLDAGTEWIGAVGRDAQSRAMSAAARTYAATLAADHQGMAEALADAAQRAELRAAESGPGVELVGAAQSARTALQSMTGAEYDLAFVESAIRLQQRLLSAIDRDVGALQNPALRQVAEQTRPTLEAHILRGRQLLPELRVAQATGATAPSGDPGAAGESGDAPSQPAASGSANPRTTPTAPDTSRPTPPDTMPSNSLH